MAISVMSSSAIRSRGGQMMVRALVTASTFAVVRRMWLSHSSQALSALLLDLRERGLLFVAASALLTLPFQI